MSGKGSQLRWFRPGSDGCFASVAAACSSTSRDCLGASSLEQMLTNAARCESRWYDLDRGDPRPTRNAQGPREAGTGQELARCPSEMNAGAPRGSRACCMTRSNHPIPPASWLGTGVRFGIKACKGAQPKVDRAAAEMGLDGRLRRGTRARRRDGRPRPASCSGGIRRGRRLRMPRGQGPS